MNGPDIKPVKLANSTSIAVGTGATVYTDVLDLAGLDTFALSYKVACTGTPNIKIEIEQGIVKPTNANAADDNYATPETLAEINDALIDENIHHQAIFPVGIKYLRFKITEQTTTVADSVLTMNLSIQNRF